MDKKQYYFLSGLPRSGSTLLSSLLSQNDDIYAGGNSPVCQLMWDMKVSVNTTSSQQILANNKLDIANNLISNIPNLYYKDVNQNIIVDKCRSWTLNENINIIKNFITKKPKIIILIRPIDEIINSFCDLYSKNNQNYDPERFLDEWSEPIMRSYHGIINIINNESTENYLIISYDDIINQTHNVINKIYEFCDWEKFNHTFDNIITKYVEDDSIYGIKDFHHVRPTISKRNIKNYLSKDILNRCNELNNFLINLKMTKM